MITVIHLPVSYLPWTVGGKEIFTHSLAKAQASQVIEPTIAIHQDRNGTQSIGTHQYEGIPVEVMPSLMGTTTRRAVYGCLPDAAPGFEQLLQQKHPNIVHFQDFSVGANLLHMRAAKAAGCGIVLTYHSPGQVCTQRSLLYRGQSVCDGRLDEQRCTRCRLGVLGVPEWLVSGIGRIGSLGFPVDTKNRLGRAMTVRATVQLFQQAWEECISLVDRFTVHADWCAELLLTNGVPPEKLVMVRSGWHGTAAPVADQEGSRQSHGEPLRVAFVGRADPVKGLHVLIDAVRSLPQSLPIEVGFFGPYWSEAYGVGLARQVRGDGRFQTPEQLAPTDLMQRLAAYDVCVVPSLWLETGPLVVLEAFAAGLPVVGSRLGGIAELVSDGQDGLLFEPGNAAELATCLRHLADEPALLERLRSGIRQPRTMADVAREMADLYRELIDEGTQTA
ncbi:hypothetical protein CKO42_19760 [Lamprobacter modestohalophilus]|uniref:Glycosyltransferase family 4 protein n=1 Tax=Lamprobacter modestohalophilus TaxID=1064514 RepID=A0A9X1B5N3_9GAMM|nr:glycosyltransferase [Lamprobacter modestohalophilus]MBK1620623.1 hypothetical protein [Lamprobacter modestohalophilus]